MKHLRNISRSLFFLVFLFATISCSGQGELLYKVSEPAQNLLKNRPVLFLLHGWGSNEKDLIGLASSLPKDMIVVSIRAPYAKQGGGFMWYDLQIGNGVFKENIEQANESVAKINKVITQVMKEYKADTNNIFLGGFSQGAIMSLRVGLAAPFRLKGIVCLSGRYPDTIDMDKIPMAFRDKLNVFISHGSNDKVIPIVEGKKIATTLRKEKFHITWKEYAMEHQITQEVLIDLNNWLMAELKRK